MSAAVRLIGMFIAGAIVLAQEPAAPALEFAASGDAKAHAEFVLGVAALHSSSYIDAAGHFQTAEKIDPNFVMAYWGEAMTFNHPFWGQQDIAAGRRALLKLAPTRAARSARAKTAREREYLNAVEILYAEGDKDARDFGFADAMKKVAFNYPNDYEAAAFYVLGLLSARRIGDPGYPQTQSTAAAILKAILEKFPNHPGGLHYLMHTYDDPEHAPLALDAARKYERTVGDDSNFHAIHMPAHIYVQLGMWADVARLNQAAFDASDRWVKSRRISVAARDYHSLEYLQYARLQMGLYTKAREALSLMSESAQQTRVAGLSDEAAIMASRFAIETGEWEALAPYPASTRIPELLFAQGLASLKINDVANARRILSTLDGLVQEDLAVGRRNRAATEDVLKRVLDARIALAEKRAEDAERLALEAAQLEIKSEIPSELNGIIKPAAEFYGEILLELKKAREAEEQFAVALKQRPKRALSLLGVARSRVMQQDTVGATRAYQELAEIWKDADPSVPAVREVRSFLR